MQPIEISVGAIYLYPQLRSKFWVKRSMARLAPLPLPLSPFPHLTRDFGSSARYEY
jgi:hypothetical protein